MSLAPFFGERLVRYAELQPCTNAFIDARSPGSDKKENFTIIGPGVAENPHQHVHIREPHGFNIGGARQPPKCTNSLHSHLTAEVFIIHQGTWRFVWGEHGDAGAVVLTPGDTISIPVNIFRGFENIGEDTGFMFSVLGGDDPGRVHWAPQVIEKARGYGLVLLDNGSLVDTTLGETVPPGQLPVQPSSRADIAYIRTPDAIEMTGCVVKHNTLALEENADDNVSRKSRRAIIGQPDAPIATPHGFSVQYLLLKNGAVESLQNSGHATVLLIHRGSVLWCSDSGASAIFYAGDTFSIPAHTPSTLDASVSAEIFIVRHGDQLPEKNVDV